MTDITLCMDDKCPKRSECHRYRAVPTEYRQAWRTTFREKGKRKCDFFAPIVVGDEWCVVSTEEADKRNS